MELESEPGDYRACTERRGRGRAGGGRAARPGTRWEAVV